jgi:hypothetical protein
LDEQVIGNIIAKEGAEPPVHAVAAMSDGYALRFSLAPFVEPVRLVAGCAGPRPSTH